MTDLINNEQDKGTATEIDKKELTGILLRTAEMFFQNSLAKSPSLQKNEKSDGYNPVIPLGQKSFLKYALSLVVRAFPLNYKEFDDEDMDRFILKTALRTITNFPTTGNGTKAVLSTNSTSPRTYSQQLAYVSDPRLSRHMGLTFDKKRGLEFGKAIIVIKESEFIALLKLKELFINSLAKTMAEELLAIHHGENVGIAQKEKRGNSFPKELKPAPDPGFILARYVEGELITKIEFLGYEEPDKKTGKGKTRRLIYRETESLVHLDNWEYFEIIHCVGSRVARNMPRAVLTLEPEFMANLIKVRPKRTGLILFSCITSRYKSEFTVTLSARYYKAKE